MENVLAIRPSFLLLQKDVSQEGIIHDLPVKKKKKVISGWLEKAYKDY